MNNLKSQIKSFTNTKSIAEEVLNKKNTHSGYAEYTLNNLLIETSKILPDLITQNFQNSEYSLIVKPSDTVKALAILKRHISFQFNLLSCISCVDLLKGNYRFMIAYDLLSLTFNSRIRVKILVNDYTIINSITCEFINSNWWEREIWDLFGLFFNNHPDLRRLLTDYGFEGHPLRKDFPVSGFIELRYDNNFKHLMLEPVAFSQDSRNFNFDLNW